jgi:hypothetical protein
MAVLGVSAGQPGITSNWPQVQQALDAYVKVRNKSTYDSVLEKMQNIAFKAAQYTDFSPQERIAASISNIPNKGASSGSSKYVGQYKLINWQRKLTGQPPLGGGRPRIRRRMLPGGIFPITTQSKAKGNKELKMAGKYKGFIKRRTFSSKWLRIGWALASDKLGKPFGRGDFGEATKARLSGKAYGGGADIKINGAGKYQFEIFNGVGVFDHRYRPPGRVSEFTGKLPIRPASQIKAARAIQERGLKKAVVDEIKNMAQLIISRTSHIWNGGYKVSSKQVRATS